MERIVITGDGNYTFACPIGRAFSFASSGTPGGAVIEAQYNSGMTKTAATGTLTIAAQPTAGDTITIGTLSYEFVAGGAGAGEISIGTDLATAKTAILGALNHTDGVNVSNPDVTYAEAFDGNDLLITARTAEADGNSIATTETFANAGNVFGAATLTGGTDLIDRWKDFTTTEIKLSNVAGEKSGTNYGAHNEINLAVSSSGGTTSLIVVFNVLP